MKYKEFKMLRKLAKNKGDTSFIEKEDIDVVEICFESILIWISTYIFVNFILLFITGKETITMADSYGYLMPLLSFATTIYFIFFCLKIKTKEINKIIEEDKNFLKEVNKKFLKNKSKENIYESINNLFSFLIKENIVKDNEKDFELSDTRFKKLLSKQLKYDRELKLIEKKYIKKIYKKINKKKEI